jgi:hypothetical protein
MKLRGVIILLGILLGVPLDRAARAAPPRDPESTVVEELVVTAKISGPAWWRVTKGASVVWVLGIPTGLPKGFKWDSRMLDRHLTGAKQVITPAVGSATIFDIPTLFSLRGKMKIKGRLEDMLPPDLCARFLAGASTLHQKPDHYDHWNGLWAGFLMIIDFNRSGTMDYFAPLPAINRAARGHGLTPKAAATYKAMSIFKAGVAELTPEVERSCLAEALDEIEGGHDRQRRAAEGWARGDVGTALTATVGFQHCLNLLPEGARLSRQSMADEASAISQALDRPGPSVAIMPLRQLLAEDGVLERLRARGLAIQAPDQ